MRVRVGTESVRVRVGTERAWEGVGPDGSEFPYRPLLGPPNEMRTGGLDPD